jgi:broad specificity phosphatase PhoE
MGAGLPQRLCIQNNSAARWTSESVQLPKLQTSACRELWYRASLALRSILAAEPGRDILVVAHNAVNQVWWRPGGAVH